MLPGVQFSTFALDELIARDIRPAKEKDVHQ
jgi:hypothetical protein